MTVNEAESRSHARRRARSRAHLWANFGLATVLAVECILGILFESDELWGKLMWATVGGVLIFNTLRRSPVVEQDARWWVWLVCTASLLRFLAFESNVESRSAFWMLVFFNLIADTALIALGKSFSLLPARRQIRTGWMYRIVRHPAYSAYMIIDVVYVTQLPTVRNIVVVLFGVALFVCRAKLEEALLSNDPAYREYMQRVRWRFVPWVY